MLKLVDKFMLAAARKVYKLHGPAGPEHGEWLMRLEMRVIEREDRNAALMLAVRRKNEGDVRRLVAQGADPNVTPFNPQHKIIESEAPIHVAVLLGKQRLLNVLMMHGGGKVDARDVFDQTPLMYVPGVSPEFNGICFAKILLASGADVNARNRHGMTPLHFAAESHNARLCNLLLKNGADPRIKDAYSRQPVDMITGKDAAAGWTPLHDDLEAAEKKWKGKPGPEPFPEPVYSVETTRAVSLGKPLRLVKRRTECAKPKGTAA